MNKKKEETEFLISKTMSNLILIWILDNEIYSLVQKDDDDDDDKM